MQCSAQEKHYNLSMKTLIEKYEIDEWRRTVKKQSYLDYIQKAAALGRETLDANIERWKERQKPDSFFGLYSGPEHLSLQAQLEGLLYSTTGDLDHAYESRRCLLKVGEFRQAFDKSQRPSHPEYEQGIPAMEPMFNLPYYIYGFLAIKESGVLSEEDKDTIRELIASSISLLLHYPEWGAHNRCMLRVWALRLAIEAFEHAPITRQWDRLSHIMAADSWGGWSIEDAEMYLAFWLKSSMEYAHYTGREEEYYALPQTRYYFDYIVHLMTPYGQIPDFGDAHFNSYWYLWAAILEKGASVYKCGAMKYAAGKIVEFGLRCVPQPSLGIARYFALAYAWCDDSIVARQPSWQSSEVLEDVIGKKVAFRKGWEDGDLFLLYNYRDEGDYAAVARSYLRDTISVRAEKMHHGHADENSVLLLVKGSKILLGDGGYRETLPNGKYRADLYHNRLVFREMSSSAAGTCSSVYEQLHDNGAYKRVRTEKLHYQGFESLDYTRTRLHQPELDLTWDRSLTFLKEDEVIIVVDWVKAGRAIELGIGNVWHTGIAEQIDSHAFLTHIPHIYRGIGDTAPYINHGDYGLIVEYPGSRRMLGTEAIRRGYGDSMMTYEYEHKPFAAGEMACYVTVLTPYKRSANAANLLNRVTVEKVLPGELGISLAYQGPSGTVLLAYKLDLGQGLATEDQYPRYSWEDGQILYGQLTTDADFAFVHEMESGGRYGLVNGIGLEYGQRSLFRSPRMSSYQFETKSWAFSDHKWKAWEENF